MSTRAAITQLLFMNDEPRPVDLCVVLGNPSKTTVDPAIELYLRGWTKRILITGHGRGGATDPSECALFAERAKRGGVPEAALLLEREATNTLENMRNSERLIAQEIGWHTLRTVAIVTKPYHQRRAHMTAKRWWPEHVELVMVPSRGPDDLQAHDWWLHESGRTRVLAEVARIAAYAQKGDIAVV